MSLKITAVIVDDEKGARTTLRSMLELYCHDVTLLGEADSIDSALPLIWEKDPDIIFLDIEMPQGSGFDLINKLKDIDSKVVFTTAYSKYALKAIKASAFDYLLKPIDVGELKETIAKSKSKIAENWPEASSSNYQETFQNGALIKKLAIPSSEGYDIVNVEDILFCEGNRNYTALYLQDKKTLVASKTLKEYERLLKNTNFVRVHQKYLVNFDYVVKYIKGRGGILVLTDGKQIPISQNKRANLNHILERFLR
ncbi:MAG: response regulator transcription factor [Cyclobacteriaceae bacterium]|nr:response regulator transcription factor [Cyclobacteriaceae bacterium]